MTKYNFATIALAAIILSACDSDVSRTSDKVPEAGVETSEPSVTEAATIDAALPETLKNDNCGIDAPIPGGTYPRSQKLAVWGYAFDMSTSQIPTKVTVRIRGLDSNEMLIFPASRGVRDDVAEALKRPELKGSGFGVEADIASLSSGRYLVSVLQEVDGKNLVCNSALPITLN